MFMLHIICLAIVCCIFKNTHGLNTFHDENEEICETTDIPTAYNKMTSISGEKKTASENEKKLISDAIATQFKGLSETDKTRLKDYISERKKDWANQSPADEAAITPDVVKLAEELFKDKKWMLLGIGMASGVGVSIAIGTAFYVWKSMSDDRN